MSFENNSRDDIFNLNRGGANSIKHFNNQNNSSLRAGDDMIFNKKKISDDIISSSSASSASSVSSVSDTSSEGSASIASSRKIKKKKAKSDTSSEGGESVSGSDSSSGASSSNSYETESDVSKKNIVKKSSHSSTREKKEIIYQLDRLEQRGYKIPFKFNLNSDLEEMKLEYNKLLKEKELDNSVRFSRKMLMAFVTGSEYLNNRYDPFSIQLDGWSDQIHDNMIDYDDIFEELHEKYKSTGKKMPPELRLFISLSGSAFMFHLTNRMFKEQKLPDIENVLKSNPDLMKQFQQAATKEYILPQNSGNNRNINNFTNSNSGNNGGPGILGMVSGLFNNISNGSMRNNMKPNYKSRDDDSDSISEIDSIIDNVHKNITVNRNNNNIETLSISDEEITSIMEDEADLRITKTRKKKGVNDRTLNI
jgi:hypothetical protein